MKRLIPIFLCVLMLTVCMSAMAQGASFTAIIDGGNADRVHLRAEPSAEASSLGLYFTGTQVFCDDAPTQTWTKVYIGSQDGYIKTEYLRWGDAAVNVRPQQPIGVTNTTGRLNIRSAPWQQSEQVGAISSGEGMTILGETADHWYYVTAENGIGYVMAQYVTVLDPAQAGASGITGVTHVNDVLAMYKLVMNNEAEFVDVSGARSIYLGQLHAGFDGLPVTFGPFAVAELDADGTPEVVVKITVGGNDYGYEILDHRNGVVYGYDVSYRALMDLKADGTFSWSSGAADTGFGRFTLGQGGAEFMPIAHSESTGSGMACYDHAGNIITEADYMQRQNEQAAKRTADWYDFTTENIDKCFGQ